MQRETDVSIPGGLRFDRFYLSELPSSTSSMGLGWNHNFARSVETLNIASSPPPDVYKWMPPRGFPSTSVGSNQALYPMPNGKALLFERGNGSAVNGMWEVIYKGDVDTNVRLVAIEDLNQNLVGWRLTHENNTVEAFNSAGRLLSIQYAGGRTETMTYSDASTPVNIAPRAGLLISVADNFGRTLQLTYSGNHIASLADPSGAITQFGYDGEGRLTDVYYPGGGHRRYHYNEIAYQPDNTPNKKHFLTGISDELTSGVLSRFAIYKYDSYGKAISTEHNGLNRFTVSGDSYIDPNGWRTTMSFLTKNGVKVPSMAWRKSVKTPTNDVYAYYSSDTAGNITEYKDFDGTVTQYALSSDGRNLEVKRVEAAGTTAARTITTQWHPTLREPITIAVPKKITSFTYDGSGNILTRTEQATTDATGTQGVGASLTGTAKIWTYTYNGAGLVLTENGPRTDIDDTTTYQYDASGNLLTVTNPLGHVTTYSDYDSNGRVGRITAPNSMVTTFTYHPRGWVDTVTVDGELTQYQYNGVGQITGVTLPGGESLSLGYDLGRRLTDITDAAGNTVHYTLDAAGNRQSEEWKDSSGNLARKIARTFNRFNLPTTETGGAQ